MKVRSLRPPSLAARSSLSHFRSQKPRKLAFGFVLGGGRVFGAAWPVCCCPRTPVPLEDLEALPSAVSEAGSQAAAPGGTWLLGLPPVC